MKTQKRSQSRVETLRTPRLENYVDVERMRNLLQEMAHEFNIGMGLLGLEKDEEGKSRLYPIVERVHFKEFCDVIRATPKGRGGCNVFHFRCALCPTEERWPAPCHACLLDLAVPVKIKNEPVAFVFAGQLRKSDIDVDQIRYLQHLHRKYEISQYTRREFGKSVSYEEFLHLFLSVPRMPEAELARLEQRLRQMAETISNFAQYSHYLTSVQQIGEGLVPVRDLSQGLEEVVGIIRSIFSPSKTGMGFLSFSIWQISEDATGKFLQPMVVEWGESRRGRNRSSNVKKLYLRLSEHPLRSGGEGHPICAAASQPYVPIRWNSRPDKAWPPREYFGELGSFLAVPILSEGTPLGVIQIGHTLDDVFGEAEAQVVKAIAGIVASLFRRHNEFDAFARVADVRTRMLASQFAVDKAPALCLGEKAMVFFWETDGDERRLQPGFPDLLESREGLGRKHYREKEGLTGWVGHFGLPLNITKRSKPELRRLFDSKLKPQLLRMGWTKSEICPPVWKEITKEQVRTSRRSSDRPLLLVPIHELNPDPVKRMPIGVIRVTDKEQGYFTSEDQRVLESFARVISLCHDRDTYQSNFIEKAVYCLMPTMSAIASRARRLREGAQEPRDYGQLQSLIAYLHDIFTTMAYTYLDRTYETAWKQVNLNALARDVTTMYGIYADCMYDKEAPDARSAVKPFRKTLSVQTNETLLRVAVLHVLDNAFKASRSADGLRVGITHTNDSPAIRIEDDGAGIQQHQLGEIGEMFVQFPYEEGPIPTGMGLGLYATRRIVLEDLKGRLIIETKRSRSSYSLVRDFAEDKIDRKRFSKRGSQSGTTVTIVLPTKARAGRKQGR
jgi:ligand-binding sensor protein